MPRAFLLVSGDDPAVSEPAAVLLPLVDRPFLQHVVERLAAEGIDRLDVIISRHPDRVESLLGDGSRWGFQRVDSHHVDHHTEAAVAACILATEIARSSPDEFVLWAQADRLPIIPIKPYLIAGESFLATDAATSDWTGWAFCRAAQFAQMPGADDPDTWYEALVHPQGIGDSPPAVTVLPVALTLSAETLGDLLRAQKTLLDQANPGLLRTGREIEPGIHLSRNVVLHHTAVVRAPVFIGQDCRIGAGAEVGPYAVIGDGCIVDEGATVAESLILAGSYVGEDVEVREAIVDRKRLMSVRFGEAVELTDLFLLGDLSGDEAGSFGAKVRAFWGRVLGKQER